MKRWVLLILLNLAVACASAPPTPLATLPPRPATTDVVDIRGIWLDTRLEPTGAAARGLDVSQIVTPRKTRNVAPVYPDQAVNARITGTIVVECVIDLTGEAKDCVAISGPPQLRNAALDAVSGWRWQPLTVSGIPKRALVHLNVDFRLG